MRLTFTCLFVAALGAAALGQSTLSLNEALRLGRQHNGNILAAERDVDAARAQLSKSRSEFLPSVTLSYGYSDHRVDNFQVADDNPFRTSVSKGGSLSLSTSITLLDTGERRLGVRSAQFGLQAQQAQTLQTTRATLVDVYSRYVEALRSQELERVAKAEVSRAEDVVKQADAQAKVGDIAQKDVFQPRADALNATVNFLAARNSTATAKADLKASIGWEASSELPTLEPIETPPTDDEVPLDVAAAVKMGMERRSDLVAQRRQVDQFGVALRLAKLASGPTLSADYSFTRQRGGLADSGDGNFALLLSYPLFDGGSRRQDIRIAEANLSAAKLDLVQSERDASAEIESLVHENQLDKQRIEAANLALEAAKINFDKVFEAKQLGAEGTDLVAISTAQVSLVTAETNAVQALYDYAIARVRLRLAVGVSVPGENP
jgi:outer membrane protein